MKRTHFIIGATLMLAFSLTGCTADSSSSLQIGTSIQPSYTEPIDYAAHRGQQQLLAVDGGSVAYTDHGTGVPIVLLHGVPTSSWMYREIIPQLQENFRVITIDFLGYGSSDKPEGEEEVYSPRAQAGRVQTV
ncbi:MAG: alpha/beta fold hydrolase, partial [Hyphomonadaceae bacterium]